MIATESSLARVARSISRKLAFTLFLTLCASIFPLSAFAQKVTITTFDPLGSVQTMPESINAGGAITGSYSDGTTTHGFLRMPDGTITSFDGPGATGTLPASINAAGAITGYYFTSTTSHGFLRAPDGSITTFDPPTADYTYVYSINSHGAITGFYIAAAVSHGFVRDSDGTITIVDPPASIGTVANAINDASAIVGYYLDSSYMLHCFLRAPDSTFATFTVIEGQNTQPIGMNSSGKLQERRTTRPATSSRTSSEPSTARSPPSRQAKAQASVFHSPSIMPEGLSATTPTRRAFRTDSCVGQTVPSPPLKSPAQLSFSRRASTRLERSPATIRPTATATPTASC
jgi:hypothetical protein